MKKIFIVDDDPDMVKVMEFRLKKAGYEVYGFTSGIEGSEKAQEMLPDLVVLDCQMPDLTGIEIADILEKNEKTKNIPIIFLSGKVDFDSPDLTKKNRELVIKPCDFEQLTKKIAESIG